MHHQAWPQDLLWPKKCEWGSRVTPSDPRSWYPCPRVIPFYTESGPAFVINRISRSDDVWFQRLGYIQGVVASAFLYGITRSVKVIHYTVRILKQSTKRWTWRRLRPRQQPAPTCHLCEWVTLEVDPPAPDRPSDDAVSATVSWETLRKPYSLNSWPTETVRK